MSKFLDKIKDKVASTAESKLGLDGDAVRAALDDPKGTVAAAKEDPQSLISEVRGENKDGGSW